MTIGSSDREAVQIIQPSESDPVIVETTMNLKMPDNFERDSIISIRSRDYERAIKLLEGVEHNSFPLAEVLLSISTTLAGCVLGAFLSDVQLTSMFGVAAYCVMSPVAVGTLVAYFFVHKESADNSYRVATDVLACLRDIEGHAGDNNEHK